MIDVAFKVILRSCTKEFEYIIIYDRYLKNEHLRVTFSYLTTFYCVYKFYRLYKELSKRILSNYHLQGRIAESTF